MELRLRLVFIILATILIYGCGNNTPIPKPIGYFRIDFPEHAYQHRSPDCPFEFDISKYSRLEMNVNKENPCWFNIDYPTLNAKIYVTYKNIDNDLRDFIEEAHGMAYQHQVKASSISTRAIKRDSSNVYGLVYNLGGNVASPYQFYLTDSTRYFLRGSFYFNIRPNPDSTKPALDYVKADIDRFINSFEWKD